MRLFADLRRFNRATTALFFTVILLASACRPHQDTANKPDTLFRLLTPGQTGVDFQNTLSEGLNTNVLVYEYFYNGGGVAIADVNGDGLEDVYFTGNMVENRLYLNKGHMKFEDVTASSGVGGRSGPWKTSATFADVNGDGKMDIYLCYSGKLRPEKRVNQLLINQGNDAKGVPVFKDMTHEWGLNFPSYSTQGYFFDYDDDGDLDLLLINHSPERLNNIDMAQVAALTKKPDLQRGVRLLENKNGHFVESTARSGIENGAISYGLSAAIADINDDGWPDIYIDNDYNIPDKLYINNKNGTFSERLSSYIGHTSFYSMGNDIADLNNDARPDIITLDMLPEDNRRQKLLAGVDNYELFDMNVKSGFYYQYMRNMLQLNNGNGTFSEIGQLAGISNTDWSWAPLVADYDNDGWKDLFITNGFLRDYTNMDFLKYMGDYLRDRRVTRQDLLNIIEKMPSSKVSSYFFKNNGGLSFINTSPKWGITTSSSSNGAAYADLDNDGDLDIVVNNINQPAFIYENQSRQQNHNHFVDVALHGKKLTNGTGAQVVLYANGKIQRCDQMPSRGYQSCVSPVLHFGLGKLTKVDSIKVVWASQACEVIKNPAIDRKLSANEAEAIKSVSRTPVKNKPLFTETSSPVHFNDKATGLNDFKRQPLLVNPLSFSTPCMIKGDVNHDGLEDIFIGGAYGQPSALYLQQQNNKFVKTSQSVFGGFAGKHIVSAALFDANHDGKPDLYLAAGGYDDFSANDPRLQDELLINQGNGNFKRAGGALPPMSCSKGCVRAADINGDGFPDLFIGGRAVPGNYPQIPRSYLLINDGKGHFSDQTARIAGQLTKIGLVTDAAWTDINHDGKPDLLVVGEWMPVRIFINENGHLVDHTHQYLNKNYAGWWNCITVGDFNGDGHPDFVVGNQGLNTQYKATGKEPAEMFYKDFDDNGSIDPILCFYIQHKSYPFVARDELLEQISVMRGRFPDYNSYADATINQVFTPDELKGAGHFQANTLATTCFLSNPAGKYKAVPLPAEAQFSPAFTINVLDYNKDGHPDLLVCGNLTKAKLRIGRCDANFGTLLKGDGKGGFSYVPQALSGFKIKGDVRSVINIGNNWLFAVNQQPLTAYRLTK